MHHHQTMKMATLIPPLETLTTSAGLKRESSHEEDSSRKKASVDRLGGPTAERKKMTEDLKASLSQIRASNVACISHMENRYQEELLGFYLPTRNASLFSNEKWKSFEEEAIQELRDLGFIDATIIKCFPTRSKYAVSKHISNTKVRLFGSKKDTAMGIIPPPSDDGIHSEAMGALKKLDISLREFATFRAVYTKVQELNGYSTSEPHRIQGERFVIPLEYLVQMKLITTSEANSLVHMIQSRAKLDHRIVAMAEEGGLIFQKDISVLVQFDAPEQLGHLDMPKGYFQFGVNITTESSPTVVWDVPEGKHVTTLEDVVDLLNDSNSIKDRFCLEDGAMCVSGALRQSLNSPEILELVHKFGNLLRSRDEWSKIHIPFLKKRGTMQCLPGGVLHAGPANDGFRATLFTSVTSEGQEPYDSDFQTRQDIFITEILNKTWTKLKASDRKPLLWRLAFLMRECTADGSGVKRESLTEYIRPCPGYLSLFIKNMEKLYGEDNNMTLEEKTEKVAASINRLSTRRSLNKKGRKVN